MGTLNTALAGIRVLDLSRIMAGPWCTQNLSDLGADVTKVESIWGGDDTRGWGPPYLEGTVEEDGYSAYFISANRGKRSIAINFQTRAGAQLIRRLAAQADVLVENYTTGTLARYGLDAETLREENPRLVYLSITGYGQTGPDARKPGYDYVFQGIGGLMSVTGPGVGDFDDMPMRAGVPVIDLMTGMYATTAVLGALFAREQTGEGQHIDLSLLEVAVALNANQGSNYLISGVPGERSGNAHPNCAPYEVFPTADGHLILAIGNDAQFQSFCRVSGLEQVATDPDYVTNSARLMNIARLRPILQARMAERSSREWGRSFDEAGVPWGPINRLDEVFDEPQVKHQGMRVDLAHERFGTVPGVRNPLLKHSVTTAPPGLGEHTMEILREQQLSTEEIDELIGSGTVRAGNGEHSVGL